MKTNKFPTPPLSAIAPSEGGSNTRANSTLPPLTQLKQCPLEDRQWAFDLRENLNQAQARAAIQERFGIPLGSDTAYSHFCEWQEREKPWDHLDAMAEQDLPRASPSFPSPAREQLRDAALLRAYAIADQSGDIDLSLCVMNADLKVRQDRRAWEKFNQERQTRLEAAFKEFFETIQLYPDLSDEFFAWRDRFAARHAAEHHTTLQGELLPMPHTSNAAAPAAPPTPPTSTYAPAQPAQTAPKLRVGASGESGPNPCTVPSWSTPSNPRDATQPSSPPTSSPQLTLDHGDSWGLGAPQIRAQAADLAEPVPEPVEPAQPPVSPPLQCCYPGLRQFFSKFLPRRTLPRRDPGSGPARTF